MIKAQPLLVVENLLQELDLIWTSSSYDEVRTQRIKAQVERLFRTNTGDMALNCVALGWIDFIQGRLESGCSWFERALQLNPADPRTSIVYSGLLSSAGEVRKSMEIASRALCMFPGQPSVLEAAFLSHVSACRFSQAYEIGSSLIKLLVNAQPKQLEEIKSVVSDVKAISTKVAGSGYSEGDMLERLLAAIAAVRSRFRVARARAIHISDGSFLWQMYINADFDVCAEMNFLIADKLVEAFESPAEEVGVFMCLPLSAFIYNPGFDL